MCNKLSFRMTNRPLSVAWSPWTVHLPLICQSYLFSSFERLFWIYESLCSWSDASNFEITMIFYSLGSKNSIIDLPYLFLTSLEFENSSTSLRFKSSTNWLTESMTRTWYSFLTFLLGQLAGKCPVDTRGYFVNVFRQWHDGCCQNQAKIKRIWVKRKWINSNLSLSWFQNWLIMFWESYWQT